MSDGYAILPCNGLDKSAGCITREIALRLADTTDSDILCPVFYRVADTKYNKRAAEKPLIVLDGCATRCASKLASEKNLKIIRRVIVSEEAKNTGVTLSSGITLSEEEKQLAARIGDSLMQNQAQAAQKSTIDFPQNLDYEIYLKDKFQFRIPKNEGFWFNENDVWAYVQGNRARIGVTDYVQQSLSDILYFTAPDVGEEIEQFDAVGDVESGKAVFEIVSPVSGKIVAINEQLDKAPEIINENPYEVGWIAEIALSDFEEDKDLLHVFDGYFPILKKKVDEFHA